MNKKKIVYCVFACIIFYALVLRLVYLGNDPMWIDETISASAAKAIVENGLPVFESGASYYRAFLFHYLMAGFMILFEGDSGARIVSVFFGVLTVALAFLFGRKLSGDEFVGIAFSLMVAVSSWEIYYSQQARFYQAFQFFFFLTFYLFYKTVILEEKIMSKRWMDHILVVGCVAMCIHLQFMGYIVIPLLFLIYLIFKFKKSMLSKKWFWICFSAVFLVGFYILYSMLPDLAWPRISLYSVKYYTKYLDIYVLSIFALVGVVLALFRNWKITSSLVLYSILPLLGLFFVKYYASRYAYFIVFPLFFYIAILFSRIRFKYPLLLVFMVVQGALVFSFAGLESSIVDRSMPSADYSGAYEFVSSNETLASLPSVVSWSPAAYWYGFDPSYQLNYTLSGDGYGFWTNEKKPGFDRWTGAIILNNISDVNGSYVLIMDDQAKMKANKYNFSGCSLLYSGYHTEVSECR